MGTSNQSCKTLLTIEVKHSLPMKIPETLRGIVHGLQIIAGNLSPELTKNIQGFRTRTRSGPKPGKGESVQLSSEWNGRRADVEKHVPDESPAGSFRQCFKTTEILPLQ